MEVVMGNIDEIYEFQITNSGSYVSNAYVCADNDQYAYIASISGGPFLGQQDRQYLLGGPIGSPNNLETGIFETLALNNDGSVSSTPKNNIYISPVINCEKFKNNYINIAKVNNQGSIEKIEVRYSNKEPLDLEKIYWSSSNNVFEYDVFLGDKINQTQIPYNAGYGDVFTQKLVATCPRLNLIVVYFHHQWYAYGWERFRVYDKNGTTIYGTSSPGDSYNNNLSGLVSMEFTYDARVLWCYSKTQGSLFNVTISMIINFTKTYNSNKDDFIYDFSAEKRGSGVWYTNKITNSLLHLDSFGNKIFEKGLKLPTAITSTIDNGCWVFDSDSKNLYRFSNLGVTLLTYQLNINIDHIYSGEDDIVWYIQGDSLGYIVDGIVKDYITLPSKIDYLMLSYSKVYAYCSIINSIFVIDKVTFRIFNIFKRFGEVLSKPALFYINNKDQSKYNYNIFPLSYDPTWGENSKLTWDYIEERGLLPQSDYIQFKIYFNSYSTKTLKTPFILQNSYWGFDGFKATCFGGWSSCSVLPTVNQGKYYFEIHVITHNYAGYGDALVFGIGNMTGGDYNTYPGINTDSCGYFSTGKIYYNGVGTTYGSGFGVNSKIGIAVDTNTGSIWFSKNGVWEGDGVPVSGTNPAYTDLLFIKDTSVPIRPVIGAYYPNDSCILKIKLDQFAYTTPSGFVPIDDIFSSDGYIYENPPKLFNITTNPAIKLENIGPGQNKSVYVKLDNIQEPKDYDVNLITSWSR